MGPTSCHATLERASVNNDRPISVIPVVSKIFEKIIYDQLYEYLNDNKLLSNCQSGFGPLHSTLTALLEATNSWSVNIDNGLLNCVVFIDLKKAIATLTTKLCCARCRSLVLTTIPSSGFNNIWAISQLHAQLPAVCRKAAY